MIETMLTALGTLEEPLWGAATLYPIVVGLARFVLEKRAKAAPQPVRAPLRAYPLRKAT
jgi:hypothetical protein